jgi:outer membrane protein insertion porin family
MFKNFLLICLIYITSLSLSLAETVSKIEISGNKRLTKKAIILFSKVQLNEDYNSTVLNSTLKELYQTDFFKSVNINLKNNILFIEVVENPIIEDLRIEGIKNKKFTEKLMSFMVLKNRKSFQERLFENDLNFIKNIIKKNGYYFSKIETTLTTNNEQNSVRLIYNIDLGKKAKIKDISFVGDKKIKNKKLKNIIVSEEARFWKIISNKKYLDEERINLDKRLLLNYYKNEGYYLAKIENSFVESLDDDSFKLIFNINAGKKYVFNTLKLELPSDFNEQHFTSINKVLSEQVGELYSLKVIEKILKEVDKIALSKQYEFINASLLEDINENDKLDFTIKLNETQKFYVEKINISGNHITLEETIRNSFIVDEGDPYNEILFNKSVNKIKSRGIFAKVNKELLDGSNENLKVINIDVEEKPTGEISLGAGLGTSGTSVGGGIKENNFLGKAIQLDANLSISEDTVKGKFVYLRPNFNYSDNDLATSIENTSTDRLSDSGYKSNITGFSLGTSFEQYENLFFQPSIKTTFEKLETTNLASAAIKKQEGDYFDANFNYSLVYDNRDRAYQPKDGYLIAFNQDIPVVSDNYEFINGFNFTKYKALFNDMVGKINFYGQAINTLKDENVRLSKRILASGSKLRGFEAGKIGPVDNGDYIGGNYASGLNFSSTLPQLLPSLESLDFNVFFDTANVWGVDYSDTIDDSNKIRSSMGIAMDILTPIGPMNFSLAQPITKKSSDKTETFRFNIGTTF